jgi:hypothetical protein
MDINLSPKTDENRTISILYEAYSQNTTIWISSEALPPRDSIFPSFFVGWVLIASKRHQAVGGSLVQLHQDLNK